ncbi:kelch domain-containing protein [Colletotrichum graminicola]|uniref:Kelch domain-containing protein n=1 Tax=Colletotrichum graminicola (strain M1.001 / M2 / FGSC 10212) TaxID=645133 RepID=E3QHV8_COLGM|nr:kelch domain-containing protein [Colletotrichum graminicola M1.001]EFQ30446.1 kelch domain-containing protein [Colletotrichum graminicola M1.001]WDK18702.1 kelch domain-containing protein [Colletotrichum graminicola]
MPTLRSALRNLPAALLALAAACEAQNVGKWGPMVKFPVVPVAVALVPETGNLLVWSSGWPNRWTTAGNGKTYTSLYNVNTGNISDAIVQNTQHDMFCPGTSLDADGRIIVTGGSSAAKTSVLDFKKGESSPWTPLSNMQISRGYQSSCTTSEGKIFVIGGSFSGAGTRNGEVYDPKANTWTKLAGCPVKPLVMQRGMFPDSHAWLWSWKNGSVLQAGPSKKMNWYDTKGTGSNTPAGLRGTDEDSMCGVSVMYDAVAGKIFTYGGGKGYTGYDSTSNAHILTLGEPGQAVQVQKLANGKYNRGFANAVVMPDGKIWVVGGMQKMWLFSDTTPQLTPELFDPATGSFTPTTPHTVPRNYHSTALLMADATIWSGGGGLCGANCKENHFDGQFWSPPYLFEADGVTPAKRPVIQSLSDTAVRAGAPITITMQDAGAYTFSMIRVSATTHTVNTDQRRIPLDGQDGGDGKSFTVNVPNDYGVAIPGYYMLFAMNEAGVPCVAQFFKVTL